MFNWVPTKFHYNPIKDGNASRKKGESITKEAKTQGLLAKQVDEFVDDWRINSGRRHTIFFMGFEKASKTKTYLNLRKEGKRENEDIIIVDNAVDEDDDELIPLMSTTFQNNFDDNNGEFCTEFEKSQVVVAIQRHVAQRIRRRVTLADLLMVDVHGNKPKPKPEAETVPVPDFQKKLPEVEKDRGSCFSEKPKAAPEPPTRNLRRLMGKMMKRKMHAKVHNEQLLCEENKLNGKLFDPTSLPILPAACA
ncbi:hypothetical protein IC582_012145 [Cucumis melo]|uniref:Protein TILLER ANGLE CONTROL 1 n=1 Tax=Cucumis melo TaxID=3656 RepID=A0A1S4DTB7_CUCME|nr:protein TILLER ANGLE CONTROL 1-like isoform X1 [Cucumis melo]